MKSSTGYSTTTAMNEQTLVSMFPNAVSDEARTCKLAAVLDAIRNGTYAARIAALRQLAATDPDAYNLKKKSLPAFTVSGTAKNRKEPLAHSALIQGDLDKLNGKLDDVRQVLRNDPHVAFGFISPSGNGIKFGIAIDPADHKAGFLAAQDYFRKTYGFEIDPSVKDRLRLCFVSHDPDLWTRPDAVPVPPLPAQPPQNVPTGKLGTFTPHPGGRPKLAESVLGAIEWESDVYGFCACPGAHLHTTPTKPKDCDVRLEGAPTIHCFHGSCANIVAGVNHQLRSIIAKAEFVPSHRQNEKRSEYLPSDNDGAMYDPEPEPPANPLPPILDVAVFSSENIPFPDELVAGVLHRGCKLVLGGGSKTFKTWSLVDLAMSIAYGYDWLSFKCTQGRVLYVNFEIQPAFFQKRIRDVAKAKGITLSQGHLDIWNLRGHAADYVTLIPKMIEDAKHRNYSGIVVDPIYKLYGELNENAAGEVGKLLNSLESLAVHANAAIAFGAHYSKGNQASKEAIDRISGSGVFARDPDSILNFTKHQDENSFTVETTLRNHEPIEPFVVTWQFPLFSPNSKLLPSDLKQINRGKPSAMPPSRVRELCSVAGSSKNELLTAIREDCGCTRESSYRYLKAAIASKEISDLKNDRFFRN